jgi:hypothetical protein
MDCDEIGNIFRKACGPVWQHYWIVFTASFESSLSEPLSVVALTAKYQVAGARFSMTADVIPGFEIVNRSVY